MSPLVSTISGKSAGIKVHKLCFKEIKNCLLWLLLLENQQELRSTSFDLSNIRTVSFGFFTASGKSAGIDIHKLCFKQPENSSLFFFLLLLENHQDLRSTNFVLSILRSISFSFWEIKPHKLCFKPPAMSPLVSTTPRQQHPLKFPTP